MIVTQKMIAEEAGVGQSWVSWVLRNDPKAAELAESTRSRILQIAQKRGYVVNASASTMRSGVNSTTVAMIYESAHPLGSEFFNAAIRGINMHGFGVRTYNADHLDRVFSDILSNQIPYIICYPLTGKLCDRCEQFALDNHLKIAFNMPLQRSAYFPSFDSDNPGIMRMIVRYLYEQGHRRIGCLCGIHGKFSTQLRHRGFLEGLADCGLDPAENWICCEEYSDSKLLRFLYRMRPTALCSISPGISICVESCLNAMHLEIPRDLALVSYGDHDCFQLLRTPITAVSENNYAQRSQGVFRYFLSKESGPATAFSHFYPGNLMERKSSAPPSPESRLSRLLDRLPERIDLTAAFERVPAFEQLFPDGLGEEKIG